MLLWYKVGSSMYLVSILCLSQVHLLAEGKVLNAEVILLAEFNVSLDLWEGPKPPPIGCDVADVHTDLVCPNSLADETSPSRGEVTCEV